MKSYKEFINENVSVIRIMKKFRQRFPTKEAYESYIIDKANSHYDDYEVDDVQDIDESLYNIIIEQDLLWELLPDDIEELPAGEVLKLHEKVMDLINKFY